MCMDRYIDTKLDPCGHEALCGTCAYRVTCCRCAGLGSSARNECRNGGGGGGGGGKFIQTDAVNEEVHEHGRALSSFTLQQ